MNKPADNPYKTPEAQLVQFTGDKNVHILGRFTAWGVFGLTIITLGIYPIYWMYSRAKILNSIHEDKISSVLLISFIAVVILSYSSTFFGESKTVVLVSGVITLVYFNMYLIVLFKIRNRLQDIINRSGGEQNKLGIVLTFFFYVIYFQYKINECIDDFQPGT